MAIDMYPYANTSQWFADKYVGMRMGHVDKLVIHTTEGSFWPAYQGGAVAPHLTALPDYGAKALLWRQHYPLGMSSRALANAAGGVQTNTAGVVQVELIGTCDTKGPGMYWPAAPEWALQDLADLVMFLHTNWQLQLNWAPLWLPYPKSYGQSPARFTHTQWNTFRGICGHQHVPENDHGDPGLLPVEKIKGLLDMALTDADITKLCTSAAFKAAVRDAVWRAGWGGNRESGGTTEHADMRLYWASHPEYAAVATADALMSRAEDLADVFASKIAGQGVVTTDMIKDAVRQVLTEGTGGTP